ncbi:thioredoxin-like protein [Polychytrium aggregatum]|uniref:thioredoxin-like protein n=1 Tax=Polychytrium aggregatum TaxID=110093 RepID=UPI0022FE9CE7|nr:thioredoxin-like protein [Polychytrium aggregatum]KAI9202082.1 thioredoxin-like protein [Polychytrium aggregatum]
MIQTLRSLRPFSPLSRAASPRFFTTASSASPRPSIPVVTLYTRQYCGLCEEALEAIQRVQKKIDFDYVLVDIDKRENKEWLRVYMYDVPVLHVNGEPFMMHAVDEALLEQEIISVSK